MRITPSTSHASLSFVNLTVLNHDMYKNCTKINDNVQNYYQEAINTSCVYGFLVLWLLSIVLYTTVKKIFFVKNRLLDLKCESMYTSRKPYYTHSDPHRPFESGSPLRTLTASIFDHTQLSANQRAPTLLVSSSTEIHVSRPELMSQSLTHLS